MSSLKIHNQSQDPFSHFDRLDLEGQGQPPAQIQVNGAEVRPSDDAYRYLSDYNRRYYEYALREYCPYCRHKLRIATVGQFSNVKPPSRQFILDFEVTDHQGCLKWCKNCNFWYWFGDVNTDDYGYYRETFAVSKVRQFNPKLPEGCVQEFAAQLRRNPELFHSMAPTRLEILVRDIFRLNFNNCESIHVGRPGDGGVDVLFIDAGGEEWLIQVKRRESPLATEGINTIRNFAGTLMIKDKVNGIIVSTADHFSAAAWDAVHRLEKKRFRIALWDKGILNRMLDAVLLQHPWLAAVAHLTPGLQKNIESLVSTLNSLPAKWSYLFNPRIASRLEPPDNEAR